MKMHASLARLLEIGGEPLAPDSPSIEMERSSVSQPLRDELNELFSKKNGFLAFEAALYVFPVQSHQDHIGIVDWNVSETWKYAYGGFADGVFSFAQDVFGNQFALTKDGVVTFNCETSETKLCAQSLGEWAAAILGDFDFLTGHSVARAWQEVNQPLSGRMRLFTKRPFVIGGAYDSGNLAALEGEKILQFFGGFSQRIRNLPDGSDVRLLVQP